MDWLTDGIHDPFNGDVGGKGEKECELFGPFGIFMQVLLGILSFSSLFAKRSFENPKRSYRIFLLDISKQGLSAGWCHTMNLFLAVYLQLKVNKGNGCEWYFVNFLSEVLFVVGISYCIHTLVLHFATKYDVMILQSGVYLSIHDSQYVYRYSWDELDKHINYRVFAIQLAVWLMIVTLAKLIVFCFVYREAETLIDLGIYTLSFFHGYPNVELVFVMMIIPFFLNSL